MFGFLLYLPFVLVVHVYTHVEFSAIDNGNNFLIFQRAVKASAELPNHLLNRLFLLSDHARPVTADLLAISSGGLDTFFRSLADVINFFLGLLKS